MINLVWPERPLLRENIRVWWDAGLSTLSMRHLREAVRIMALEEKFRPSLSELYKMAAHLRRNEERVKEDAAREAEIRRGGVPPPQEIGDQLRQRGILP